MKKITFIAFVIWCTSALTVWAQHEILSDYKWDKAEDLRQEQQSSVDPNSQLVYEENDSLLRDRFKKPIQFTRSELNKIKDPRVRDIYWYALNDSTDRERYLKAHYAFNRGRDNWAVEFGAGGQTVFINNIDFDFSVGPQFEVAFKKDLHPYWAARGVFQVSKYKQWVTTAHESTFIDNWQDRPTTGFTDWRQKITYSSMMLRADVMLNILNLAAGRELLYNPFDIFVYVGSGGAYSAHDLGTRDGSCFVPFWLAGFKGYLNFSERWSMYLDMNASWQGDDYQGYSQQNSTYKVSAMLGLSYQFSKVIHFQRLGYDDTKWKQMLDDAYEEGDQLATYIQTMKKDTILPAEMIEAAFFQIDRIELAHTYVLNLGFYADLIKAHPSQQFLIRGFADLEVGSKKRNEWLRQKRAEVVYDILTKTYNVKPEQLVLDIHGDLEIDVPFLRENGHHRFNRCTIICPLTRDYKNIIKTTEFDDKSELMDGRVESNIKKDY